MASYSEVRPAAGGNAARRTAILAAGDVLVFVLFAALGRRSHGEAAGLQAIAQVLETAAPFALSWLVVASVLGAYRKNIQAEPKQLLTRSLLAWVITLPCGVLLRALIRQSEIAAPSFWVTTFLIAGAMLGIWRGAFSWWLKRGEANGN